GRCRRWAPSPPPGSPCWSRAGIGEGPPARLRYRVLAPASLTAGMYAAVAPSEARRLEWGGSGRSESEP
ncbi:MAG TPA: hypothetical protein VFQ09_05050, partial [Rubrobacter sp.]|nr:hypothetical protein [Rubrobacter sp.]